MKSFACWKLNYIICLKAFPQTSAVTKTSDRTLTTTVAIKTSVGNTLSVVGKSSTSCSMKTLIVDEKLEEKKSFTTTKTLAVYKVPLTYHLSVVFISTVRICFTVEDSRQYYFKFRVFRKDILQSTYKRKWMQMSSSFNMQYSYLNVQALCTYLHGRYVQTIWS